MDGDNQIASRLADLRRQAKAAAKQKTERRVYLLPITMVERIVQHQLACSLPSETAAALSLLDSALTRWEASRG